MSADREYAARHGMTLHEFQVLLLKAAHRRGRVPLTKAELQIWRFANADGAARRMGRECRGITVDAGCRRVAP